MKPVWPPAADAALKALLATRKFVMAECFTLSTVNGSTLYWTTAQQDVTVVPVGGVSPVTYSSGGPLVSGLNMHASIGTSVDQEDVTITARPTDMLEGFPLLTAIRFGLLDGGRIKRDRWFAESWGDALNPTVWVGAVPMFYGRVGPVDKMGRVEAQLKISSDLALLSRNMPRDTFQPSCMNTLYDAQCALSKASFTFSGSCDTAVTASTIPWAAGAGPRFKLGTLQMTSGANTGLRRAIKGVSGTTFILVYPFPIAPNTGDTFTASYGCNKVYEDGSSGCLAFSNQANFRGTPFQPQAETAI